MVYIPGARKDVRPRGGLRHRTERRLAGVRHSGLASGPSSGPTPIPVMELVSLPTLVNNNNTVINNRKVSLTSPRPEPERETNLYTEAPKKLLLPQKSHISVISQNSANQQSSNLQRALNQSSGDPSLLAALNSSNSSKMNGP